MKKQKKKQDFILKHSYIVDVSKILYDPKLEVINFLNSMTLHFPKAISLESGRPADKFCQIEKIGKWIEIYSKNLPADTSREILLGQYGRANGIIREHVAKMLEIDEGIRVNPQDIMITVGSQEAMSILLLGLFDRDADVLLTTDPVFIGIIAAAKLFGIEIEPISINSTATYDIALFEKAIFNVKNRGKNPKAIYVVPDFDNPLSTCMPLKIRKEILVLAEMYNILILEDNPYGIFRYEGKKIPTIKFFDKTQHVIYLSTFSKTLFPGLRVGFLVADQKVKLSVGKEEEVIEFLSKVKSLISVNTSPIIQAAIGGALIETEYSLKKANKAKILYYRKNRDIMIETLERNFQSTDSKWNKLIYWNKPDGGFFLTVTLPFKMTKKLLFTCANDYGIIITPISYFSILPGHENQVRLAFSNISQDKIENSINHFSQFIKQTYKGYCQSKPKHNK